MELKFGFAFHGKQCSCFCLIDCEDIPCYLFVDLYDTELIDVYGNELSIKTDFRIVLPKEDDHVTGIVELRWAIFNAIKDTDVFKAAKERSLAVRQKKGGSEGMYLFKAKQ
jgi:hypothetical protein